MEDRADHASHAAPGGELPAPPPDASHAAIGSLRAVIGIADELISCPTVDAACRRAVELARERLGVERCAVFLREGDSFRGTWGTDGQGQTTDEHTVTSDAAEFWGSMAGVERPDGPRWQVRQDDPLIEWKGTEQTVLGRGWVAATPVRTHEKTLGIFFNDTAITGAPLSPAKQEVLAVYCSLLGNILERREAEEAERRLGAGLRTVVALADELISCSNRDELYHRAVVLAHERLGFERCGIHVKDGDMLKGTWGTNRRGQVVDEHRVAYPVAESCGPGGPVRRNPGEPLWELHQDITQSEWNGESYVAIGRGWLGVTPIQSSDRFYGLFFNDGAITGARPDPVAQEVLAVYCSMLGTILERLRAQEEVVHAERMAAVGTLAGGIAHEFNNLHAVIIGNLDLALEDEMLSPAQRTRMELIRKAASRASGTTRDLLTFSRRQESRKRKVSLVSVAEETVRIVANEFESEGIETRLESCGRPQIEADPGQIGQVIMNLLINARHAMLEAEHKELSVTVGTEGDRAYVRVADTGCGIKPEVLSMIFVPFFTTKGEHAADASPLSKVKGTGLGLSVTQSIMRDHGGEVTVESAPGAGSTFTVWLPLRDLPAAEPEKADRPVQPIVGARILVVDDERLVRELAVDALGMLGYVVEATDDGATALEMLARERFDLVIVDLQMPKMSGVEFLQHVSTLAPSLRPAALVSTGRDASADGFDAHGLGVFAVLEKPWALKDLGRKVAAAITEARGQSGNASRPKNSR